MKKKIHKFVSVAVIVVATLFIWNIDASAIKDRNGKRLVTINGAYCCQMTTNSFNNCTGVPDCAM